MSTVPAREEVPIESTWNHESVFAEPELLALEEDTLHEWQRQVSLK